MNKQEFIRFLKMEVEDAKNDKASLQCLCMMVEAELEKHLKSLEIETDKGLKDVFSKMRDYASQNKEGSIGCCPPGKAVEIAFEVFGIKQGGSKKESAAVADLDLDDLLS